MAQWLKELAAIFKDLGSNPCTNMSGHSCLSLQFQGDQKPPHRHACRQNTNAHRINKSLKKRQDVYTIVLSPIATLKVRITQDWSNVVQKSFIFLANMKENDKNAKDVQRIYLIVMDFKKCKQS